MAKENGFGPGDIVRLKSGGPDMTVQEEVGSVRGEDSGKYWCQWFAGRSLQRGQFRAESLETAHDEASK